MGSGPILDFAKTEKREGGLRNRGSCPSDCSVAPLSIVEPAVAMSGEAELPSFPSVLLSICPPF